MLIFQGKFYLNTGKRTDFWVSRTKNLVQLCFLSEWRVCNYHGGLFDLGFGEGCGGVSSNRRGKRSCQVLVQDENQCFLLCGLSMIASRTDLLN